MGAPHQTHAPLSPSTQRHMPGLSFMMSVTPRRGDDGAGADCFRTGADTAGIAFTGTGRGKGLCRCARWSKREAWRWLARAGRYRGLRRSPIIPMRWSLPMTALRVSVRP